MILTPLEQTAEKQVLLQKNGSSYREMGFPAERGIFLQNNALSGRNVVFGGHMAGNCTKLQEGFRVQEPRTLANFHKNLGICLMLSLCQSTRTHTHTHTPRVLEPPSNQRHDHSWFERER